MPNEAPTRQRSLNKARDPGASLTESLMPGRSGLANAIRPSWVSGGLLDFGSASTTQPASLLPSDPNCRVDPPSIRQKTEADGRASFLPEPVKVVDAVLRAAANKSTGGLADNVAAAGDAALGFGGPGDFGQRYRSNLQREQETDEYDAERRPIAHAIGAGAGDLLMALAALEGGYRWSNALSPRAKGQLGEGLSWVKTRLSGDYPTGIQVRTPLSRSYTVLDQATERGIPVEAKFGFDADLSPQQRLASTELPDYRVDWWTPNHVGLGAGALGGLFGLSTPDPTGRRF